MERKKTLLISHDSSLTGASLSFCYLAEELSKLNKDIQFDILLLGEGPLVENYYKNFQNVYFSYPLSESFIIRNSKKVLNKLHISKNHKAKLIEKLLNNQYDMIIGNTISSLQWLTDLKDKNTNITTILAVHELDIIIKNYFPISNSLTKMALQLDLITAVSNATRLNLINKYNISPEKIKVIHPHFNNNIVISNKSIKKSTNFRIGLVGYLSLIKGSDLVPRIAFLLREKFDIEDFSITFFGTEDNDAQNIIKNIILSDATKLGIANKISFKTKEKSSKSFFHNMDVFLMISREESFSLVTIESILSGTPVVLFDDIGGPNEILNKDEAYFSPYLDVDLIAQNLFEIYTDNTSAIEKTIKARERILNIKNQSVEEYNKIIRDYA